MSSADAACAATFDADFDAAVLGGGLGEAAEAALREAGLARDDPPRAMAALMQAQALAPQHPAVLIAFYRHHFYGHRYAAARDIARRALVMGAERLGLPTLWRELPERPLPGARDDAATRFFLFTLKGYAYLSLRLGDLGEAREALAKLRALDPEDRIGAALLESVRQRAERRLVAELLDDPDAELDDDALQAAALPVFGALAWARTDRREHGEPPR